MKKILLSLLIMLSVSLSTEAQRITISLDSFTLEKAIFKVDTLIRVVKVQSVNAGYTMPLGMIADSTVTMPKQKRRFSIEFEIEDWEPSVFRKIAKLAETGKLKADDNSEALRMKREIEERQKQKAIADERDRKYRDELAKWKDDKPVKGIKN